MNLHTDYRKKRQAKLQGMRRSASMSSCEEYRYSLSRVWDEKSPRCMFIGLNPSTADHRNDDPTIRKCIGFAKKLQFGGFEMLNLYAYRATDPGMLHLADDPLGPLNIAAIMAAAKTCNTCIVAWGHLTKSSWRKILDFDRRTMATLRLIESTGYHPQVYCLGMTKQGYPRHPLYVKYDTPLQVYTNPRLDKYKVQERKRRGRLS